MGRGLTNAEHESVINALQVPELQEVYLKTLCNLLKERLKLPRLIILEKERLQRELDWLSEREKKLPPKPEQP